MSDAGDEGALAKDGGNAEVAPRPSASAGAGSGGEHEEGWGLWNDALTAAIQEWRKAWGWSFPLTITPLAAYEASEKIARVLRDAMDAAANTAIRAARPAESRQEEREGYVPGSAEALLAEHCVTARHYVASGNAKTVYDHRAFIVDVLDRAASALRARGEQQPAVRLIITETGWGVQAGDVMKLGLKPGEYGLYTAPPQQPADAVERVANELFWWWKAGRESLGGEYLDDEDAAAKYSEIHMRARALLSAIHASPVAEGPK